MLVIHSYFMFSRYNFVDEPINFGCDTYLTLLFPILYFYSSVSESFYTSFHYNSSDTPKNF